MVLKGILSSAVRGSSVPRCLFAQLEDLSIEVTHATFELMVEVCIKADDLETTSDFLMKMDEVGLSPSDAVLDKVMEMYLAHVARNQHGAEAEKVEQRLKDAGLELSSASSSVVPPPPPPLPPALISASPAQGQHPAAPPPPPWEPAGMPEPMPPLVSVPQAVNGIGGYTPALYGAAERPNASSIAHDMMELAREECKKKLPAFSIPDEFAAEGATSGKACSSADREGAKSPEQQEVGSSLSAAAAVFVPVSQSVETVIAPSMACGGLSAAAAEFVPVAMEQATGGNSALSAHAAEFVPVTLDPVATTAAMPGQFLPAEPAYDAPYVAAYDAPYDAAYDAMMPYEAPFDVTVEDASYVDPPLYQPCASAS